MAIQLIITKEHGLSKNENPMQGAFIIEELTDLVEQAVLDEFERINDRGGVLGAMETQYQRGKIQEESMYYEQLKHTGQLPIIGVNTYLNPNPKTEEEINSLQVAQVALSGGNIFAQLMETVRVASLGQITKALYEVGGKYRRNM
ncbi:vitamin B12-dependent enzyme [Rhizophagus irregularis]|uniref:Vitamin B12-dependent enzyme n=1 Tax=Rhizophagus irregularis TaxID=588596 RepID=A0A2N0QIB3_9GLOM|nr:vitamin B12-dependent enzyme [Rhizophagus irregularis]